MAVATREELKQYCLRKLGAPVLEINVADVQLEDRIDEALEYWRHYHYEGIERVFLKQLVNASLLNIVETNSSDFTNAVTITGQTSGATCVVATQPGREVTSSQIIIRNVEGAFAADETIVASNGATATLTSTDFYIEGETEKRYFDLPDIVYGVTRILPFANISSSKSIFDIQYQLRLNDLYDLTSTSIIYYKQVMSHLALLDLELNGRPMMRFNRMQGRLYPDVNWESDMVPGTYIIIDCYRALDPTEFSKVWNEQWLKHYVTALFKKQWGTNLKKFQGIQLPGGVVLDGQSMYDEASNEIEKLEDELMNKSAPLDFFLG